MAGCFLGQPLFFYVRRLHNSRAVLVKTWALYSAGIRPVLVGHDVSSIWLIRVSGVSTVVRLQGLAFCLAGWSRCSFIGDLWCPLSSGHVIKDVHLPDCLLGWPGSRRRPVITISRRYGRDSTLGYPLFFRCGTGEYLRP